MQWCRLGIKLAGFVCFAQWWERLLFWMCRGQPRIVSMEMQIDCPNSSLRIWLGLFTFLLWHCWVIVLSMLSFALLLSPFSGQCYHYFCSEETDLFSLRKKPENCWIWRPRISFFHQCFCRWHLVTEIEKKAKDLCSLFNLHIVAVYRWEWSQFCCPLLLELNCTEPGWVWEL